MYKHLHTRLAAHLSQQEIGESRMAALSIGGVFLLTSSSFSLYERAPLRVSSCPAVLPLPQHNYRLAECTMAPLQSDWRRQQGLYDRLTNGLSAWRRLIPLPSIEAAAQRPTVSFAVGRLRSLRFSPLEFHSKRSHMGHVTTPFCYTLLPYFLLWPSHRPSRTHCAAAPRRRLAPSTKSTDPRG